MSSVRPHPFASRPARASAPTAPTPNRSNPTPARPGRTRRRYTPPPFRLEIIATIGRNIAITIVP
ncbi:MAG: hypothetical protein AAF281_00950, partial [Pseudomonadota bacterium]